MVGEVERPPLPPGCFRRKEVIEMKCAMCLKTITHDDNYYKLSYVYGLEMAITKIFCSTPCLIKAATHYEDQLTEHPE